MEMQAFINGLENTMKKYCLSVGEGLGLTLDLDQREPLGWVGGLILSFASLNQVFSTRIWIKTLNKLM